MSLKDYLKDQIFALSIVAIVITLLVTLLWVFDVNLFLLIYLPLLVLFGVILIFSYDFWRKCNYYNEFTNILDHLDQKYLITELIKQPAFLDGKIMVASIYEIDKAMKEHINDIRQEQIDFKEYTEMWCHEVKTPLATSLMMAENNPNAINQSLQEELMKIDNYLEQVLFYSRSANVEKDYLIKKVNLATVVNTVIKRNKKDLIARKVKIELENLNLSVNSDLKWLEFILNQIINNAIKYMDKDPVLKISADVFDNRVELSIQDNGIGILKEEIDRVFDKGFTGTNGRSHQKSTGIGLYLCKKLCQKLNHEIKIVSNQGTCVTIVFPDSSYISLR